MVGDLEGVGWPVELGIVVIQPAFAEDGVEALEGGGVEGGVVVVGVDGEGLAGEEVV